MSIFDCCFVHNDYTVVDETSTYYVCRCNVCGNYYRRYK